MFQYGGEPPKPMRLSTSAVMRHIAETAVAFAESVDAEPLVQERCSEAWNAFEEAIAPIIFAMGIRDEYRLQIAMEEMQRRSESN